MFGVGHITHITSSPEYCKDNRQSVPPSCLFMLVISAQEVEFGDKEGQDCFRFFFILKNSYFINSITMH